MFRLLSILLLALSLEGAAPVISNVVTERITHSSVRIRWTTDVASSTSIKYGTTTSYGKQNTTPPTWGSIGAQPRTVHAQFLSGLTASTTYHFCPYSVNDADSTPSVCNGTTNDNTVTTSALPSNHMGAPALPADVDTSIPAVTGTTYTVTSDCGNFSGIMKSVALGDEVVIPPDAVCDTTQVFTPVAYTCSAATDTCTTASPHGILNGMTARFNTTCAVPSPLTNGGTYILWVTSTTTFKVRSTYNGSDINLTSDGCATSTVTPNPDYEWATMPTATGSGWLTIRSSAAAIDLPPVGVKTSLAYEPVMPKILTSVPTTSASLNSSVIPLNFSSTANHYRFVGIEFTTADTAASGVSDPPVYYALAKTASTNSYIIYDRCIFKAQPAPNRMAGALVMDGSNIALIDSDITGFQYWRPYSTVRPNTSSSTVVTFNSGTWGDGAALHTYAGGSVTITGGAGSGSTIYTRIYFDIATGNLKVINPTGASVTMSCTNCDIVSQAGTTVPSTGIYAGYIGITSATFSGGLDKAYSTDYSAYNTEGTSNIEVNIGPGPLKVHNNSMGTHGISFFITDSNSGEPPPADITFTNNTVSIDQKYRPGSDTWEGGANYSNRQPWECKKCLRVLVDGNIFDGNWADVSNGYMMALTTRAVADPGDNDAEIADITITNNIIRNSANGINVFAHDTFADWNTKPLARLKISNNVFENIDGHTYVSNMGSYTSGQGGNLIRIYAGAEDVEFSHNTAVNFRGTFPGILAVGYEPSEGLKFDSNILWHHGDNGLGGVWYEQYSTRAPAITGNGTTVLDGYFGSSAYSFAGNVIVTGFTNSLASTGEIDPATKSGNFPAGNSWPGGATHALRAAAVGFMSYAGGDYRLAASSTYKNDGADGNDPGYLSHEFVKAQGKVEGASVKAGYEQAIVRYVAPNANACSVELALTPTGSTITRTADGGGSRSRSVRFSSLTANTDYAARILCAVEQPSVTFHTKSIAIGTISLKLKPPTGVDEVSVDVGETDSLEGTPVTASCSTGCTVTLPSGTQYYRWHYLDASDVELAVSSLQVAAK